MKSQMQPSLDDYLHAKILKYQLNLFRDIDNQRNLQIDWMKSPPGHTQPKVVILDTTCDKYLHGRKQTY